jgi:MFS family permease
VNSSQLNKQLRRFTLFNVLAHFVLYYEIDKAFMALRGLTVTQMVAVEITYASLVLVLEVPLGALSDRWSRKYVLALNIFFFMLNTYFWVVAKNVNFFLIGGMFGAVHTALVSGTDTSFLYDTLKEAGREKDYARLWGRTIFVSSLFGMASGILGAMLVARFGLSAPFWLTLLVSAAALVTALTLREPRFHRSSAELDYWQHIRDTAARMIKQPGIVQLVQLWVMLNATFLLADEYNQLYFLTVGIPLIFFGYLGTVSNLIEALGGRLAERLAKVPRPRLYRVFVLISAVGFLGGALLHNLFGVIFTYFPLIAFYFALPILLTDLHRNLPSAQRATGESFVSLLARVTMIPLGLAFAFLSDHRSIFAAFFGLGVVLAAYLLVISLQKEMRLRKYS